MQWGPLAFLLCIVAVAAMIVLGVTLGGRNNPRRAPHSPVAQRYCPDFARPDFARPERDRRARRPRVSLYRDEGVVLRTMRLGEADRIVTMLCRTHGKVRAVAKGVRRTTSRFGGRLEPLSHVSLLCWQGRELDIVNQAEVLDSFRPIREDLNRVTKAFSMLEVADRVSVERHCRPPALRAAGEGARSRSRRTTLPLVVPAFFLKVLAVEGSTPLLDACATCGSTEDLMSFDLVEGGVLCRECRRGRAISPAALEVLRGDARRRPRERPRRTARAPGHRGDRTDDRGDGISSGPVPEDRPGSAGDLIPAPKSRWSSTSQICDQPDFGQSDFGFYVHVPFCAARCDYCAFATWTDRDHLMAPYTQACVTEARHRSRRRRASLRRRASSSAAARRHGSIRRLLASILDALPRRTGPR